MSSHANDLLKATVPDNSFQRFYRSTSEVPRSSKPHRHHRPHLYKREKEEKVDKTFGSSLHQSSTHEGTKSEWTTPYSSHDGSKRTSLFTSADDILIGTEQREKKIVKEGEVKAESEKNLKRVIELKDSLKALNKLSSSTTSRLDNSYYSVLEKLGALNDTIASLKELTLMTRKLNDDFMNESSSIVREIDTQLDTFKNFAGQEHKIESLKRRVEAGRGKAESLSYRVEAVNQKIERWEKAEGEWQQRTRKRLKFLWAITAITFTILAGLMIFQYTLAQTQGPGVLRGLNISNMSVNPSRIESRVGNDNVGMKGSTMKPLEGLQPPPVDILEDDPRLRAFDEL